MAIIIGLGFAAPRIRAQANEVVHLLHDYEAKAASGVPRSYDDAEPVLEQLQQASKESINQALPTILQDATSPYASVRRVVAGSLFCISLRSDGRTMLASQTGPFTALLVDPDIPIRRMTGLTVDNLRLDQSSPLLPSLQAYLTREDAVSTIGAGVAGLLMKASPNDAESVAAVVRFMRRKDQNSASRDDLLQSVRVANSHNREIGAAVAGYADDPNEATRINAIQTMQAMGPDVIADNRQILLRVAQDSGVGVATRSAAMKALPSSSQ